MGKALLDWRLLGAGLLREAPRQARLCLESAANQKPSRQPRQVAQQSVTVCSTFLTTDERHQIWLFILRRAVERPTCNDGLRDRPRHRTSNWSRNSFPNWSWLKPTNSSQNFGIKRAGHRRLFFYVYRWNWLESTDFYLVIFSAKPLLAFIEEYWLWFQERLKRLGPNGYNKGK